MLANTIQTSLIQMSNNIRGSIRESFNWFWQDFSDLRFDSLLLVDSDFTIILLSLNISGDNFVCSAIFFTLFYFCVKIISNFLDVRGIYFSYRKFFGLYKYWFYISFPAPSLKLGRSSHYCWYFLLAIFTLINWWTLIN